MIICTRHLLRGPICWRRMFRYVWRFSLWTWGSSIGGRWRLWWCIYMCRLIMHPKRCSVYWRTPGWWWQKWWSKIVVRSNFIANPRTKVTGSCALLVVLGTVSILLTYKNRRREAGGRRRRNKIQVVNTREEEHKKKQRNREWLVEWSQWVFHCMKAELNDYNYNEHFFTVLLWLSTEVKVLNLRFYSGELEILLSVTNFVSRSRRF